MSPVTIPSSGVITVYLDVKNTGTTTWQFNQYSLGCSSGCMGVTIYDTSDNITPGAQARFNLQLYQPYPWSVGTYTSHWSMWHNGTPFGQDIATLLTVTTAIPLVHQDAPSCNDPAGVTWSWQNASSNTITCSGGLLMRQSSSAVPEVDVISIPGSYNSNYFNARVHVHFADANSGTYAGFVFHAPSSNSQCGGVRFEVRPDGAWRSMWSIVSVTGGCNSGENQGSILGATPSTDYDLGLDVEPSDAVLFVNGSRVLTGGYANANGIAGLDVRGPSGSSTLVTFSNFEVADPNVAHTDQFQVVTP